MRRLNPLFKLNVIVASILLVSATGAVLASPNPNRELDVQVQKLKTELQHDKTESAKIKHVASFQNYVTRELEKQKKLEKATPEDNSLALTLIGFDQDIGSFMDDPNREFSAEKCAAYRTSLIFSYSGTAYSDSAQNDLPYYTQDSLEFLKLLCQKHK